MRRAARPNALMRLPLSLLIWGVAALSMWLPATHALIRDQHEVARAFFYTGLLGMVVVITIGVSLANRKPRYGSLGQLLSLLAAFSILPAFLAIPLYEALQTTSFINAYFDMVSAVTTTGANIYENPARLDASLHLWRAQIGWMGGFLMWVAASSILAPMSLGGFEVTARGEPGRSIGGPMQTERIDSRTRLLAATRTLAPVYAGLTGVVWVLLMMAGESTLTAISHAMSVMATSGISPVGGVENAASGRLGEIILFLFMFFALSRLTFSADTMASGRARLDKDPEFRIGLLLVFGLPILLFLRHWFAAYEVDATGEPVQAIHAFWGAIFTVLSFLSTTGFESADWDSAQRWSGLGTPGLILMGLAVIGGGVATTAGGVKLLRVYALYLNGLRDMERLIHPSSVSGEGARNRRIQKDGAFIAWIFFMLFAVSLAAIATVLAALGSSFEDAIVLTVATLSTTGPLIDIAAESPIRLADLGAGAKAVLCVTMTLGRLETLAIVALITPDLWRR